jgi:cytochrome b involved in lipid metabolism
MSKRKIHLTIEGHIYDVTNFTHPGEGIRNIYLRDFKNKDCSEEFDHYHMTNEPWEILEEVRKSKEYRGIKYVGPRSNNSGATTTSKKSDVGTV